MHTTLAAEPRLGRHNRPLAIALVAGLLAALLAACGSGSGNKPTPLPPSGLYANHCAVPRVGTDPQTGSPYLDMAGTLTDEKTWVRSWIDETYLWYREVPNLAPGGYATPVAYFGALKTSAVTSSGRPKDQFHFTYPTDAWVALSQGGAEAGYGAQWIVKNTSPRLIQAAYVEAGSPAASSNIMRGTVVTSVDGVDALYGNTAPELATLNAGLFPAAAHEVHTLGITGPPPLGASNVMITSAVVVSTPVPVVKTLPTASGNVGYVLFNDHIAPAELQLAAAVNQLSTAGITDLVLDLRYNGGGYLFIASQAAYMIAGPAATTGKNFEKLMFNDKAGTRDPVTGLPNDPTPFYNVTSGLSGPANSPLPNLGLSRLFVLTGSGTCSASESIINGLRGLGGGFQVIQIGNTTCGKPYGFYPQDNCGTTYFTIQFKGVNNLGFGDYADGFVPDGTGANGVTGCVVGDDLSHPLGDPAEARLAMALGYRASGTCTPAPSMAGAGAPAPVQPDGQLIRSPLRENRILLRPRP